MGISGAPSHGAIISLSQSLFGSEAPLLHPGLDMHQRCELALTGFLLWDLWSLLASRREQKCGLKKGSCQIASQTRNNLQSIALTAAAMCLQKSSTWTPFQRSMSKVAIEQYFGRIRATSQSGDVHCRSYWSAAAGIARAELAKTKNVSFKYGPLPSAPVVEALSESEPLGSHPSLVDLFSVG